MKTLNEKYYPMYLYAKEFCEGAERAGARPVVIALERGEGEVEHYATVLYNEGHERENFRYAERIVKFMLWAFGKTGDGRLLETAKRQYRQKTGDFTFTPPLPEKTDAKVIGEKETISLIPMGAAKIRVTVFPTINKGE